MCTVTLATIAALAHAAPPTLQPVALTDSPAPMQPQGVIYQDFSVHPAGEILGFEAAPVRISRDGQIAFAAWIGVGPIPATPADSAAAFYAGPPHSPTLLFNADDPIPGTTSMLTIDNFFGVPPLPYAHAGRAVISGALALPDSGASLWRENELGDFELLAAAGGTLPGLRPGAALTGGFTPSFDADDVYLLSEIDDSQASDLDPSGFWRFRLGEAPFPIAVVDNQAPGRPAGVVFGQVSTTQRLGVVHSFDTFDDGRIAFIGINKGAGISPSNDEAIWIEQPDHSLDIFLTEGDAPPPHPEIEPGSLFVSSSAADGTFTALGAINANAHGHLVFQALVDPGPAPDQPRMPTVWTTRDGGLELIIRGYRLVQGFRPGTPAPGIPGDVDIRETVFHDINDDGDLLLFCVVQHDHSNPFNSNFAVFAERRNGLVNLSYDGGPVPGVPDATWVDPRFSSLRGIIRTDMLPNGDAIIIGNILIRGLQLSGAIVYVPKSGPPALVARTGASLDLFADGSDIREVSVIRLGQGVADNGDTAHELGFTDGSRGLFRVSIDPSCNAADLAEPFGQLDFSDVVAFLTAFGAVDPAADLAEPLGQFDFSDVVAFLSIFAIGCP